MKFRHAFIVMAGILATACAVRANTITLNYSASSQTVVLTGIGDNGTGTLGRMFITPGSCVFGGVNTVCTLSGNYSSLNLGYMGGSYSFVTTFAGTGPFSTPGFISPPDTGPTPLIMRSLTDNVLGFVAEGPSTTTMTLDLNDTIGGSYVIPIFDGTTFVNNFTLTFVTSLCSGIVTPCGPFDVGEVRGATLQGPVSGTFTFDTATVVVPPTGTPEPATLFLLGTGLLGLVFFKRKLFAQ